MWSGYAVFSIGLKETRWLLGLTLVRADQLLTCLTCNARLVTSVCCFGSRQGTFITGVDLQCLAATKCVSVQSRNQSYCKSCERSESTSKHEVKSDFDHSYCSS